MFHFSSQQGRCAGFQLNAQTFRYLDGDVGLENGRFAGWMSRILDGLFFSSLFEIAYLGVVFSERLSKMYKKDTFTSFFTYTFVTFSFTGERIIYFASAGDTLFLLPRGRNPTLKIDGIGAGRPTAVTL